jgi:hypothetical protein
MIVPLYGDRADGEGAIGLDATIGDAIVQPACVERRQHHIDLHLRGRFLRVNKQGDESKNR